MTKRNKPRSAKHDRTERPRPPGPRPAKDKPPTRPRAKADRPGDRGHAAPRENRPANESSAKQRRRRRRSHQRENGAAPRSTNRFEVPKLVDVPGMRQVPHLETPAPRAVLLTPTPENESSDPDFASEEAPELGIGSRVVAPNVRFEAETSPPSSDPGPRLRSTADPAELEAQIRSLEARLDVLIRRAALASDPPPPPSIGDPPIGTLSPVEVVERSVVRPAEPALSPTKPVAAGYVERQWGREALRNRLEEVDDFGLDPAFESKLLPGIDLLYRRYFRVQVEGIHHVPSTGRAVIVANHGGTLPLDGAMLRTAIRLDHPSGRDLRWLAEDFVFYLPFAGVFLNRIGAVRACPENAERLLEKDSLVAVFPEGVHGIKKLFRQRYQLQRFGRGGYIRLCLRMRAPLIPCAIIGAEETNPLLYRFDTLAELWKLPYLPVTPTFPLLGPLGLVPAPTRWKLRFGEPISFDHYGPEALDDHVLVGRLSERVRAAIQGLLDSGLSQRKSVWFG